MKLKDDYANQIKKFHPKTNYLKNCLKAFLIGGSICLFGQMIENIYIQVFSLEKEVAGSVMMATLILFSSILTGIGVYDKIGQFAGAGSILTVAGFANSMTSAALEHKSEGFVLGVAANMFKIAGSSIVFGIVFAYVVGFIRFVFTIP
ncbi:stage V sporulation protein AC [Bacillus alveayuensis]|jgi:stage V sporulation protein AC|uniref:stage V sporulation protein AC n=1 Tax=Aeribacillus alveayuensis TaxID=279215 RepID=UPI0005D11EE5|nr:stage V sporulation protein AC [Bacillus alveayuensis]